MTSPEVTKNEEKNIKKMPVPPREKLGRKKQNEIFEAIWKMFRGRMFISTSEVALQLDINKYTARRYLELIQSFSRHVLKYGVLSDSYTQKDNWRIVDVEIMKKGRKRI